MKITATIKSVKDQPKDFAGREGGTIYFVDGEFQEGVFSLFAKSAEKATEQITILKGLEGQPHEYEVEENGEYNGRPKYKLKSWPGKPAFGGGGFSGGGAKAPYVPRYRDSEQGAKEERDSISRSVALQQAVVFAGQVGIKSSGDTLPVADHFYAWLVKNNKPVSQAFQQEAPKENFVAKANRLFNDPEPEAPRSPPVGGYAEKACPNCGATEHVRKSKLDGTPPWYCYRRIGGCGHKWGDYSPQTGTEQSAEPRSPAVLASEEISKAVKAKDDAYLMKVAAKIVERVMEGKITQEEEEELNIEVTTAKSAIKSGLSYDEWHRQALQAVQNRQQEHHPDMQEQELRF